VSHGLLPGQDCTAGSRVYVQDSVYDKFMNLLIKKVASTPIGDGFDEAVTSGPIVSERVARVRSAICGGLTRSFDRSREPNLIRCGVTLIPVYKKAPKLWSVGEGVRARVTSWNPQVRLPVLKSTIATHLVFSRAWESLRRC